MKHNEFQAVRTLIHQRLSDLHITRDTIKMYLSDTKPSSNINKHFANQLSTVNRKIENTNRLLKSVKVQMKNLK